MNIQSVSIIIPVYNELDNLEPLLLEVIAAMQTSVEYEVIYVDDGSHDGTRARLGELSTEHTCCRPIYHTHNSGQSAALVSGVHAARFDWIITLDGDGQNDPADIPKLLATAKDKAVVLGNRKKRDDNWLRKLSSRIANNVRRSLLRDECPDTGCSLKLFPRDAFLALPHFNHCHRFLPTLFKRAQFTILNVPVNHRARQAGVSKYGVMNRLWVGIVDLFGVMWLLRRPINAEFTHEPT